MKPISVKAIANIVDSYHESDRLVTGVQIDSRKVSKGDLFCALPGKKVQGESFLEEVASKQAVAALVPESYRGLTFGLELIYVPDVLKALQKWAQKSLAQSQAKVVAITGSIGKTTTKEFAKILLEGTYKVHATPLSYNSQATLPLTILMREGNEEIILLEMGMSEPGQIAQLVSIAPPDIALLTTVSLQHATAFPEGLEAIAKEKAAIFSHLKTKIGLLYHEMPFFEVARKVGACEKRSFSMKVDDVDFQLIIKDEEVVIKERSVSFTIPVQFPMHAHYHNFLGALAIARTLHVDPNMIVQQVSKLRLPPNRFERVERQGITFINDAYNANPEAMVAALQGLPPPSEGGKRIAVISEMDALGVFSDEGHLQVGAAAALNVDHLLCIGSRCEIMRPLWAGKPFELLRSKEELRHRLQEIVRPGDVVLLKGARAYALNELIL